MTRCLEGGRNARTRVPRTVRADTRVRHVARLRAGRRQRGLHDDVDGARVGRQGPILADAPRYAVGDEWRFTAGFFGRVVALEGERVVMVGDYLATVVQANPFCQGCRYVRDANGTLLEVRSADGVVASTTAPIGFKLLDFPLQVGKEWRQDTVVRQASTGNLRSYTNRFYVAAYERVQVKAGTFDARSALTGLRS